MLYKVLEMARKARVVPESQCEQQSIRSGKSFNKSLDNSIAFENPDLSSAITGKEIDTNETTNNLQLSDDNKSAKTSRTSVKIHKRIARSVSEVVAEKEKQERNVCSRFAHSYRRNGIYGIFLAVVDEVDLFKSRCSSCSRCIVNNLTCAKQINEQDE